MKVYLEKENKYKTCKATTCKELLTTLKINPNTVIVIKNGVPIMEDEKLKETDDIKILSVVSGG